MRPVLKQIYSFRIVHCPALHQRILEFYTLSWNNWTFSERPDFPEFFMEQLYFLKQLDFSEFFMEQLYFLEQLDFSEYFMNNCTVWF